MTGERSCYPEDLDKLIKVGGYPGYSSHTVELIDLKSENKTQFPNYLVALGSVGTYIAGKAMVCGGGFPPTNFCYFYEKNNGTWVKTVSMGVARQGAVAVMLSPTQWWITGGSNGTSSPLSSTEIYTVGIGFAPSVDLPEPKFRHNLVQVNATHFVLLGGSNDPASNKAWMFDVNTENWTPLPDLLESRGIAQAGLVSYPNGTQAIIAAGGVLSWTSEILVLNDDNSNNDNDHNNNNSNNNNKIYSWKYGPDLPESNSLWGGTSVPYNNSFIIVGGYNGSYLRTILSYDPVTEEWVELPQKMELGREYATAFLVPDNFEECT